MRRSYVAVSGAMALLIAAACTDKTAITDVGRGLKPHSSSKAAAFSTINEVADGSGHCKNGNPAINCNIYDGKQYVWLSGGPSTAYAGPGNYLFAVLQPGGQPTPNDGGAKNLSDQTLAPLTSGAASGDSYLNRVLSIDGTGAITYGGSHDFLNNEIRLMPYDDTPNPGGVYILAICKVGDITTDEGGHVTGVTSGYPVSASDCKYDAFKIVSSACVPTADNNFCGAGADADVQVHKTLNTYLTRAFSWNIDKSSDVSTIQLVPGQSTTIHYTVDVGYSVLSDAYSYKGTVTIINTGLVDAHNVSFSDTNSDITLSCKLASDGSTVVGLSVSVLAVGDEIDCTYGPIAAGSTPPDPVSNTATVSWDKVEGGSFQTNDVLTNIAFPSTPTKLVDDCVTVADTFAGSNVTGQVCVGGNNPAEFKYDRIVTAPSGTGVCGNTYNVDNTASFTTNTNGTKGSDPNRVVETIVCGCTLGYWKNNDLYTYSTNKGYVVAPGGANGGTDYFWKGTTPVGTPYAWTPNNYKSQSSKDNQTPQAFGTSNLSVAGGYGSLAGLSFYAALSLPGGSDFTGKAQNLMRQATAALLNATWGDGTHTISYPLTGQQVIDQVNTALLTKNATTIDNLQKLLAGYNQAGTQDLNNNNSCPLNSKGDWYPH